MQGKKCNNRISNLLLFLYAWFACFNQYFKLLGVPVFMYILVFLMISGIYANGLKIGLNFGRKELPVITAIMWILYGLVYAFFLNNEEGWRYLLLMATNVIGYFVIVSYCAKSYVARDSVAKGLITGLLSNLFIATWEIETSNHIVPLTNAYVRRFAYKPLGFFVNTNDLSVIILTLVIVLIVWLVQNKRSRSISLFCISITVYSIYVLIYANSTTCIILIPFLIVLSVLLYINRHGGKTTFLALFLLVVGLIFVVLGGGIDIIISRYFSNVDFDTISGRNAIWAEAMNAFSQSMGLGIGPGQSSVKTLGLSHNIVVELLSEYGIFIFIPITISYIKIIKFQMRKESTLFNSIGKVFIIMTIPLSIATSSLTKLFPFWIAFALIVSTDKEEMRDDTHSCTNISN